MKWLWVLTSLLLLAGCAVSPQQISIVPQSEQSMPMASAGRDVLKIRVIDARPSPVLGTLGGTYNDSSTLSASNDIIADLEQLLGNRLAAAGYRLVSSSDAIEFRVTLEQLDYQRVSGTLASEVQVRAVLSLVVDDGRRFIERTYRSSTLQTRITRPTATDNKAFLEEVLTSSLDRLLQDASVHEFLAMP